MPEAVIDMPDKLAECAFRLFSERGIGRVTMDDIAAQSGVTKGSLYWHYRSKAEVIQAACNRYYNGWRTQMAEETGAVYSPGAKLARAIRSSVRTCLIDQRNRTFTLELFTLSIHDPDVRQGWQQFFQAVKSFYVNLLQEARASGESASSDPAAAVDLMLAAMEGYKLRALFEPDLCAGGAEPRIAREMLEIVGLGVGVEV